MSFSRGSSQLRDQTQVSLPYCRQILYHLSHQRSPNICADLFTCEFDSVKHLHSNDNRKKLSASFTVVSSNKNTNNTNDYQINNSPINTQSSTRETKKRYSSESDKIQNMIDKTKILINRIRNMKILKIKKIRSKKQMKIMKKR